MIMKLQAQPDLAKALAEIAAVMPLARAVQRYKFALFLQSHPLPVEDSFEEIAADEKLWDEQFAAASDEKLAVLLLASAE